jgi:hypothetical protein
VAAPVRTFGGMLQEITASGALSLQIGPRFASEDAARIHDLIERSDPGTPIQIDFARVRDCQDFALALLARDLVAGGARVAIFGMSQHQQRLLGYFGVPARTRDGDAPS